MSMDVIARYRQQHMAAADLADWIREWLFFQRPRDEDIRESHCHAMRDIMKALGAVIDLMESETQCGSSSALQSEHRSESSSPSTS